MRARIDDVLARPEFRTQEHVISRAVGRFLERLLRGLGKLLGVSSDAAATILAWTVYTALAVALALIVVAVVRRTIRARREPKDERARESPRARRVADLLARAREADARGDLALALRLYFTALVVGLGESGGLEYRDAWTNRELLERGAPRPEIERILRPLVPDLDRKSFGAEPVAPEDTARLARLCHELLGRELLRDQREGIGERAGVARA